MTNKRRRWLFAFVTAALAGGLAPSTEAAAPVIALSNSYCDNTWHHEMVESFQASAEETRQQVLISRYIVPDGDGSVNQQRSQLSALILQHVDAIVIDAASESALNAIIAKDCAAGIKVMSFDSIVSAPCAYKLNFDFKRFNTDLTNWIAHAVGEKGNFIIAVLAAAGSGLSWRIA